MRSITLEFLLFFLGWSFAIFSAAAEDTFSLELCFLALGSAGLLRMAKLFIWPEAFWSTCNILAAAGMATYYLGGFFTLILYTGEDLTQFIGVDFPSRSFIPIIFLSSFYWILVIAGQIENGFWEVIFLKLDGATPGEDGGPFLYPGLAVYLLLVSAGQIVLMANGGWTYEGFDVNQNNLHLPIAASLFFLLSQPIPAMTGWLLSKYNEKTKLFLVVLIAVACQMAWFAAAGRRVLLFAVVTFVIGFFWASKTRKRLFYLAAFSVPLILILSIASQLFLAIRYVHGAYMGAEDAATYVNLLTDALNIYFYEPQLLQHLVAENYGERLFILQYLTIVVNELSFANAQRGLLMAIAVMGNVPSFLFPSKIEIFLQNDFLAEGKNLVNYAVGLPNQDSNYSPFVEAYGDFLWFGAIVYPLAFLGMGWVFYQIVKGMRYPVLMVGGLGSCMMNYLATEGTFGALIGTIRPLVLFWLFARLVAYLDVNGSMSPKK